MTAEQEHTATMTTRAILRPEVVLVFALSLGQSAVYSLVSILAKLTAPGGLAEATSTLNSSVTPERPWLDLTYQLLRVAFALVPAALAVHLLARDRDENGLMLGLRGATSRIGLDLRRPGFDATSGFVLAGVIGIPGLCLYFIAREFGLNSTVIAANLAENWWTVPVLVLAAIQNSLLEEVLVVGYLVTRLTQLKYGPVAVIAASSLLRGAYHLYQGFGGFLGNVVMGVLFAIWYRRTGRIGPLIVAHALLDIVAFVGFALLKDHVDLLIS